MNRTQIIQAIIDKKRYPCAYLEIGVDKGSNFLPIRAAKKVAVDPAFRIPARKKVVWWVKNPANRKARYHKVSSDGFFAHCHDFFDVVFIDGLHTYQQSLQDVIHSLQRLRKDGVIIMHDCLPPHAAAAYPAESIQHAAAMNLAGWNSEWCGDVWKTICYLRSHLQDLNVFVLDCDYGLGIITQNSPDSILDLSSDDIKQMSFDDLSENKESLLNLKHESEIHSFLNSI